MHLGTGFGLQHAPWSTELHLQNNVFHVFEIVFGHITFCIEFWMILVWFLGSQHLTNCVFIREKRHFFTNNDFRCSASIFTEIWPARAFVLRPETSQNRIELLEQSGLHKLADQEALYWAIFAQNGIRIANGYLQSAITGPIRGHQNCYFLT